MVQLTEVVDEEYTRTQPGPEEDDDDFTDTGALTLQVLDSSLPTISESALASVAWDFPAHVG